MMPFTTEELRIGSGWVRRNYPLAPLFRRRAFSYHTPDVTARPFFIDRETQAA
ncbi:MAG: hypothetical protein ACI9VS_000237 [Candidatus Binatia bacterium]|jgi:hypothetical protein